MCLISGERLPYFHSVVFRFPFGCISPFFNGKRTFRIASGRKNRTSLPFSSAVRMQDDEISMSGAFTRCMFVYCFGMFTSYPFLG